MGRHGNDRSALGDRGFVARVGEIQSDANLHAGEWRGHSWNFRGQRDRSLDGNRPGTEPKAGIGRGRINLVAASGREEIGD